MLPPFDPDHPTQVTIRARLPQLSPTPNLDGDSSVPTSGNADSTPPVRAGRYLIEEEIARGGMGVVYRASDPDLGRTLAVKILQVRHQGSHCLFQRFFQEARITGRLQHPSIPPIHELGTLSDGRPFFAMKLIQGETLSTLLGDRSDPLQNLSRWIDIFEQVCQAVAYAHSVGVIHRDLKPSNVMVGAFGEVQLMDWGFARLLGDTSPEVQAVSSAMLSPHLSEAGSVVGTPAYMAPEQARSETTDTRTDVFGLGGILCEILTGKAPRSEIHFGPLLPMLAADLSDAREKLAHCACDPELISLTLHCLQQDADDRPQNAGEVACRIAAYQSGVRERLAQAERDRALAAERERGERHRRRLTLGLAVALITLLVGSGAATLWYQNQRNERAQEQASLTAALALKDARLEQELFSGLQEVHRFRLRAQEYAGNPSLWSVRLNSAETTLTQLLARLEDARERLPILASSLYQETKDLQADQRDYRLIRAVSSYREIQSQTDRSEIDQRDPPEAELLRALAAYGMPVAECPSAEACRLIRSRPERARREIIAILDLVLLTLAAGQTDPTKQQHLRREQLRWLSEVLFGVDDNPWRQQVRQAMSNRDVKSLQKLAHKADLSREPITFLTLLAEVLPLQDPQGERLLRRMQLQHPDDFWINHSLGMTLTAKMSQNLRHRRAAMEEKAQLLEAVGYFRSALSCRPDSGGTWINLGLTLGFLKDLDGAKEACQKGVKYRPKLAVGHLNLGSICLERGEVQEAIRCFQQALLLNPNFTSAQVGLGLAYRQTREYGKALDVFRQTVSRSREYAAAWTGLATVLRDLGDRSLAREYLLRGYQLAPNRVDILERTGWLLVGMGDHEEGRKYLEKALQLDPHASLAHIGLASIAFEHDQWDQAIALAGKALEVTPGLSQGWIILARSQQHKGNREKAWEAMNRILRSDPSDPEILVTQAILLAGEKRLSQAEKVLQQALKICPTHGDSYYNLGLIKQEQGDLVSACRHFRQAVSLRPQEPMAHNNLGVLLLRQGDLPQAIHHFREALRFSPRRANYHANLALALFRSQEYDAAHNALLQAIELDPSSARFHIELCEQFFVRGRYGESLCLALKAIERAPKDATMYRGIISPLLALGQYEQAVLAGRKAVELQPDSPASHGVLGDAFLQLGRFDDAHKAFRRCVELLPANHPQRTIAERQCARAEQLRELHRRLETLRKNNVSPESAEEAVALAKLCARYLQGHADAVRFYEQAFKMNPQLLKKTENSLRYTAACSAVLAAGAETSPLTEEQRTNLRKQALNWLQAEFAFRNQLVNQGKMSAKIWKNIRNQILADTDLQSVRSSEELQHLPADERAEWMKLWKELQQDDTDR